MEKVVNGRKWGEQKNETKIGLCGGKRKRKIEKRVKGQNNWREKVK